MKSTIWDSKSSKSLFNRGIYFIYKNLFEPKSKSEDSRRHELILNIILFSSNVLTLASLIMLLLQKNSAGDHGIPVGVFLSIVITFLVLYMLSRIGQYVVASYILIGIYLAAMTYGAYRFEVDLPILILSFALLITISTILISSRFGVLITGLVALIVISIGNLQINGKITPTLDWKYKKFDRFDLIELVILYAIIMAMSWLSNREMERSLARARKSEAELRHERDVLELKVEERTRELHRVQMEKITQLDRFAEFGRMASGLFHDLANPLTSVSLSISQLKESAVKGTKEYLDQAFQASKNMGEFLQAIRRQLQSQEVQKLFSLNEEVENIIKILNYKAKSAGVEIKYVSGQSIPFFGNPLKFHQVAMNLISNAIDAYENGSDKYFKKEVLIELSEQDKIIRLNVRDWGVGISPQHLNKIFEPFFTTKKIESGTGIGLTITKDIIQEEFNGKIKVESRPGDGSLFSVEFPARRNI